jgi:hypothetical protein
VDAAERGGDPDGATVTASTAPVPVDPTATRLKLIEYVRHLQAEALKFPAESSDRIFLQGQALGVFAAVREMTLDLAAACDAAQADQQPRH